MAIFVNSNVSFFTHLKKNEIFSENYLDTLSKIDFLAWKLVHSLSNFSSFFLSKIITAWFLGISFIFWPRSRSLNLIILYIRNDVYEHVFKVNLTRRYKGIEFNLSPDFESDIPCASKSFNDVCDKVMLLTRRYWWRNGNVDDTWEAI